MHGILLLGSSYPIRRAGRGGAPKTRSLSGNGVPILLHLEEGKAGEKR